MKYYLFRSTCNISTQIEKKNKYFDLQLSRFEQFLYEILYVASKI